MLLFGQEFNVVCGFENGDIDGLKQSILCDTIQACKIQRINLWQHIYHHLIFTIDCGHSN